MKNFLGIKLIFLRNVCVRIYVCLCVFIKDIYMYIHTYIYERKNFLGFQGANHVRRHLVRKRSTSRIYINLSLFLGFPSEYFSCFDFLFHSIKYVNSILFWLFSYLYKIWAFVVLFYRLKVNNKYYQQFMDLFKQWELEKQKYEKQQKHLIVGITASFIINLL